MSASFILSIKHLAERTRHCFLLCTVVLFKKRNFLLLPKCVIEKGSYCVGVGCHTAIACTHQVTYISCVPNHPIRYICIVVCNIFKSGELGSQRSRMMTSCYSRYVSESLLCVYIIWEWHTVCLDLRSHFVAYWRFIFEGQCIYTYLFSWWSKGQFRVWPLLPSMCGILVRIARCLELQCPTCPDDCKSVM